MKAHRSLASLIATMVGVGGPMPVAAPKVGVARKFANGGARSGAAEAKRAAKRRRNVAKRNRSAS
ncbi:hypothetical protein [Pseudoxanthomonas winnipegensis]|uniref:Uncharacterized protein n=1 Tax=Pseudoxanthomonas winnipegensis TaxID=2480810 RepID=A0A4Q8LXP7_9GAMM|nr:hypothetical protein [Pseudoxanthomonas winnipegensis]RZZ90639.1 hypothetical protein EA663_02475 [Pseudoxanthomonas winnipegensis]TAA37206.1 hypothetical protein EA656_00565 [Pseudoxanthomonas winnipegensis]